MKYFYSLLLLLAGLLNSSHSVAQNTFVIGKAKSYIETRYLPNTHYISGGVQMEGDLEKHIYNDSTKTLDDINHTLVIMYKDDICTTSMLLPSYNSLGPVLEYMNSHYKKAGKDCWFTVDGAFLIAVFPNPSDDTVRILAQVRQR